MEMKLPTKVRKILFKEAGMDGWMLSGTVKAKRLLLGNVVILQSIVTAAFHCVPHGHFIQSPCFSTLQVKHF